jgi:hypothetical protein
MILEIQQKTKIKELKNQFHQQYPCLKIEFFEKTPGKTEYTARKHTYYIPRMLTHANKNIGRTGVIAIDPWITAGQLEASAEALTGLHIQIYRIKGNHWIGTSGTADLTLSEHNEMGRKSLEKLHRSTLN